VHRIALIGFGAIAEHAHLPALRSFPEIEVVAVADLSPARRERVRELLPHAAVFDAPLDLIANADVTGVDICTPPGTHAELIEAACARGLRTVVCEKPFVLSEEEYARVCDARVRSGATVVSVNNWMHSHLDRRVREVLEAGSIGPVQRIVLQTGRPDVAKGNEGWQPNWRTSQSHAGGGIILDHGWHQLYLLMGWLDAWPVQVSCVARTADPRHAPVEDEATIELLFPSAEGRIELSWTSSERRNAGVIIGANGSVDIHDDRVIVHGRSGQIELPFEDRLTVSSYHPEWFRSMLACTILAPESVESDRNFAEAGVLVSTIRAAYRSAEAGGVPCPVNHGPGSDLDAQGKGAGLQDVRSSNASAST
jgi:predicted dehydrogenase